MERIGLRCLTTIGLVALLAAGCGDDDDDQDVADTPADVEADGPGPDADADADADADPDVDVGPDADADADADADVGDVPAETLVAGRVWNYSYYGTEFTVDYPYSEVTVTATGAGGATLGTTTSDVDSCTPWSPSDPYMCGYYELTLDTGVEAMFKATDNPGYKDTLSQIFTVEPGAVRILAMMQEDILTAVSTLWTVTMDPAKGYVVGIVARPSGDVHASPFSEFIGGATVAITPTSGLGTDYRLVYYDSASPANTGRADTDPGDPLFVALNLPPRSFDDPYELTVTHGSLTFAPVRFAVEADVLTYVILAPND